MILQALKDLAEAEGLMTDPDYDMKPLHWIVELSPTGKLRGFVANQDTGDDGKARARVESVPKVPRRTSGIEAQFLYDKSDYLLGVRIRPDGRKSKTSRQLHSALTLHKEALTETGDEGLRAVTAFLENQILKKDRLEDLPEGFKPGEWMTFRLVGEEYLVCSRPKIKTWWKARRMAKAETPTAQCLVTGEPCVPAEKHDAIKKLRGASTAGVSLVTYNSSAFESYGLERNDNAPVSRAAAEAYVRALNRLVDPSPPDPKELGKLLPRRCLWLGENTTIVFWTASPSNDFADGFLEMMRSPDPDPSMIERLLTAPRRGRAPALQDPERFYALTLAGGQGRATIVDWFVTSVAEIAANMKRYFGDLALAFPFDQPPPPSISALLRSVVLKGEDKNIPPRLADDVFRDAIRGSPLPFSLLGVAVHRCRAEGAVCGKDRSGKPDWGRSHLRMQVIKAVLLGLRRDGGGRFHELPEVKPMLDENIVTPPYLLGRLFAVLERLQSDAQGQTNATITDRFYGSASTAPVVAFPRLVSLSRHHLGKLRKDNPGWAVNAERRIGSIMDRLPPVKFPSILSLEEQGLFAIGYYHQRQALFAKKTEEGQS